MYTEDFRQKYSWAAIQLHATTQVIEPVLTMFRFRSIKPDFVHLYEETSMTQDTHNYIYEEQLNNA